MKKIFTLAIIILTYVASMQAQTVTIHKNDGTNIVLLASEIDHIDFEPASEVQKIVGSYIGIDSINVGKQFPYKTASANAYEITANSDSSINITMPEEHFDNTVMGNLVVGTYTIKNIEWDSTQQAFVRNYGNDGITFHYKSSTIDKDYTFDKPICQIIIKNNGDGTITITNTYQMGNMPFPIYSTIHASSTIDE